MSGFGRLPPASSRAFSFSEGPDQTHQASKRGVGARRLGRRFQSPGSQPIGMNTAQGGAKAVFIPIETANLMPGSVITNQVPGRDVAYMAACGFWVFVPQSC